MSDIQTTQQPRFWVTCYTDGSYRGGTAGWGIYVRSERGRFESSGACDPNVHSALEAELAAIHAGVAESLQRWGPLVRGVAIFTDCQPAITLIKAPSVKESTQKRNPGAMESIAKIWEIVRQHGIYLRLVWVRGHQSGSTPRAYLNRRCDELASRPFRSRKKKPE